MDESRRRSAMVESLERTPSRVSELVAGRSEDELARKPSPATFSMRENIHHLRDIDVEGYAVRLARLLDEEGPVMADLDGDGLARERRYNQTPHGDALEELRNSRLSSVSRLRSLPPEAWPRTGELEGTGTVSVDRLLELWCAHDAGHLADLQALATIPIPERKSC